MASFIHDGVTLAYDDIAPDGGTGEVVVLVHGFTSNRREGWRRTGWYDAVRARGARCVALDQRGHGESDKLYEAEAYAPELMAADVLALMDHLGLGTVELVGYSMGAATSMTAALAAPGRFAHVVLGGIGADWMAQQHGSAEARQEMAAAMLAADPETIADPMFRSFRLFIDEQGEDPRAMAACIAASAVAPPAEALRNLATPVMVLAGARDRIAGDPEGLAQAFGDGRGVVIPGCDHFSAIPHALTKAAVFDFLDGLNEDDQDPFARSF
jgi:pimeloyl-ACP methyl ester carboxylesterase